MGLSGRKRGRTSPYRGPEGKDRMDPTAASTCMVVNSRVHHIPPIYRAPRTVRARNGVARSAPTPPPSPPFPGPRRRGHWPWGDNLCEAPPGRVSPRMKFAPFGGTGTALILLAGRPRPQTKCKNGTGARLTASGHGGLPPSAPVRKLQNQAGMARLQILSTSQPPTPSPRAACLLVR